MLRSKIYIACILLSSLSSCQATYKDVVAEGYVITSEEDGLSQKWQDYLYNQLSKRSKDKSKVVKSMSVDPTIPPGFKEIHVEVATDLKNDYCIKNTPAKVHVRMREEKTALWMVYQLIAAIAQQNPNFNAIDLPPTTIEFKNQCTNFDFSYRDVHLQPNMDVDYAALIGTNSVESDWGIWAHNLHKVLKVDSATQAEVNGVLTDKQYCFSSEQLYLQLHEYIDDNYGNGKKKPYRFMIAPNDNDQVCTCEKCKGAGNDQHNATPAVFNLINRLAQDFPKHHFYALAYRTTLTPPDNELLDNCGVFISTIAIPKGVKLTGNKNFNELNDLIQDWKKKTPNLYLWDYISNFDDYLTPLPILTGLKKQFPDFIKAGIKGLFLNGSGYDYSPFDDVKTYAAAALMMNAKIDIDSLTGKFFAKKYPVSHQLLNNYYLSLENKINQTDKPYSLYGNFKSASKNYLATADFIFFYNSLTKIVNTATGEEKENLEKLLTALSFTRLQVAYLLGFEAGGGFVIDNEQVKLTPDIKVYLKQLSNYVNYKDLARFKENGGYLKDYLAEWQKLAGYSAKRNLLSEGNLSFISSPDEDYTDIRTLNDGIMGFGSNYQQGWLLSSKDDLHLKVSLDNLLKARNLNINFLNDEEAGIYPPTLVEIIVDGKVIKSLKPKLNPSDEKVYQIQETLSFGADIKMFEIKMLRSTKGKRTIGCDEIQLTK